MTRIAILTMLLVYQVVGAPDPVDDRPLTVRDLFVEGCLFR